MRPQTLKDDISESEWAHDGAAVRTPTPEQEAAALEPVPEEGEREEEENAEATRQRALAAAEERRQVRAREEEKRHRRAAKVIQKAVRNWIRRKRAGGRAMDFMQVIKKFIDGQKDKVKQAVQGKGAKENERDAVQRQQQMLKTFGMDSLAMLKPAVVEEYMAEHNLRHLLTVELANLFKEKHFPSNPFPHFYRTLREHHAIHSDLARATDKQLKKMMEDQAEVVFHGSRDGEGRKAPITAVEVKGHLAGEGGAAAVGKGGIEEDIEGVTIFSEVPTLLTTDAVMLQRLAVALGPLLKTVKQHSHYAGHFTVARALVGPCIHHLNLLPFPAAVEITDECKGEGPDLEALLALFCDHVISDLSHVTQAGYHQHAAAGGGGEICLGIAGAAGEAQQYRRWSVEEVQGKKRGAFIAALQSATVNKRPNFVDLLLQVRVRALRGDRDRRSQEELGAFALVRCRKRYSFTYHSGHDAEPARCFATVPFASLYRGVFFDHDAAQGYACKTLPEGRGGGGGGASITPTLTTPWVHECCGQVAAALRRGDVIAVARLSWAPNRVRYFAEPQKGNAPADAALPAQVVRLLGSGANRVRVMCEQLDTLCEALRLLEKDPALDDVGCLGTHGDPDDWAPAPLSELAEGNARAPPGPAVAAMKYVHPARTARVVMGQVRWLYGEFGALLGTGLGGEELDAGGKLVLDKIEVMVERWLSTKAMRPRETRQTLAWIRDLLWCASMAQAALLHRTVAPIDVSTLLKGTAFEGAVAARNEVEMWSRIVVNDVVPVDSEVKKAIASFQVPASLARESIVLEYCTNTGLDTLLEELLRRITDDALSPQPIIQGLRLLRTQSQRFLLWKNFDLDMVSGAQMMLGSIALAAGDRPDARSEQRAQLLAVYRTNGKFDMIMPNGKPLPPAPQPALLPPPEASPGPVVYGSKSALLRWLLMLAGAGEGPAQVADSAARPPSTAAGARGGVHSYLGYMGTAAAAARAPHPGAAGTAHPPTTSTIVVPAAADVDGHGAAAEKAKDGDERRGWSGGGWWACADDVMRVVESVRDRVEFPAGAYTLTKATAVRHVVVNPVPFTRVGRLRFSRLSLYHYLAVEGPKVGTALQMVCRHVLAHISHLHNSTPHIPFGIYIAPRSVAKAGEAPEDAGSRHHLGPRSEGPNGLMGDEQGLQAELPGAGHRVCSPAAMSQQKEAVMFAMQKALQRGDTLYVCGLAWLPPPPPLPPAVAQHKSQGTAGAASNAKKSKSKGDSSGAPQPAEDASKAGYVLFTCVYNVSYMPSETTAAGRRPLPEEVDYYFRRDDHAPCTNVFASAEECAVAHSIYPSTVDPESLDPCAGANASQHVGSLAKHLLECTRGGQYLGALDAAGQAALLSALRLPAPDTLGGTLAPPRKREGVLGGPKAEGEGPFEANHKAASENPQLLALADWFRCGHALTQQLVCLQAHLMGIAAVLASAAQAAEVRAKVNLKTLAAQAARLRVRLLELLLEDGNKMFLDGVSPGLYQASGDLEAALRSLSESGHIFTDPLLPVAGAAADASGEDQGGSGEGASRGQAEDGAGGWQRVRAVKEWLHEGEASTPFTQALRHVAALHTSLAGLVQVTSAAVWENCANTQRLLRADERAHGGESLAFHLQRLSQKA